MKRLPSFPATLRIAVMAIAALQLRSEARAWQDAPAKPQTAESAPAPEAPAAPPTANAEAEALIAAARERLSRWQSISAQVVQRIDLGDRRFQAKGRFQAGEFPKTRLEYEIEVGQTIGRLLEVCDGQVLHVERRIEDAVPAQKPPQDSESKSSGADPGAKPTVEAVRRDVQRLLRASASPDGAVASIQAADIGLGGLAALLASLDRSMVFDSIREETHDGQTFKVIQGAWDPDALKELQAKLGAAAQQLTMFLPERVRIYFESDSLFPVRILYLKRTSPEKKTYKAVLSLEFHDVEFDSMLPPDTFTYRVPAGVQQKDDTDEFVNLLKASLGQQAQAPAPEPAATPLNLRRTTEPAAPK